MPNLKHIVYSDPRGMRKYDDPRLMEADKLAEMGRDRAAREPGLYDQLVDATKGEDVAILCTTSGTTAHPKLAMLAAGRVLRHCATYLAFDPKGPDDEYVSVLPLPWIMEQVYVLGKGLLCRMKVNFVEQAETMMNDFREIAPTFVLFAPRVWESIAADVRAGVMDSSPLKQSLYEIGMKTGLAALAHGKHSTLADMLLFRALRDRLGFTRLRSAATGGAALGPDTFKFFQAMGVPLRTLYGQTETLGAYTLHPEGQADPDTTGVPMADSIEIRIDNPDIHGVGEIMVRHPNMFLGYFKNPEASAADITDGWMHSGDAGYFNADKQLVVIDRIKDLAETARGERFSPQYIENKLKFSPYIAETVVLGAGRDALAAMICIRFSIISKWAEKKRIAFTTYTDLASRPEVYALLQQEVEAVNATLPPAQRISRFLLLYKELDADDGELTRTRKVRRSVINEKYADIIDAHLWRQARHSGRHRDPLPGRHHPAYPDHAARGRPRARRAFRGGRGMNTQFLIQLLVNGLVVGTLYGVVAMSFVLIYKATQVVNFAQGELLLVGAWVCWALLTKYQVPFWIGMPLTLVFMFVFGIAIQIVILRPMIGEPVISVIMVTIGLSTVFQAALKWIFGVNPQPFPRVFESQSVSFLGLQIQTVYVMSLVVSVAMMVGMAWFFRVSKYGLAMRATAFNQQVAQSLGISVKSVFAMAWAISATVSAVAGVVVAVVNGVSSGLSAYGIKVFPAAILGGLDSIGGAVLGGVIIGLLENIAQYVDSEYLHWGNLYEIAPFYVLIIILMIKPYGLFGTKDIERV